MRTSSTLLALLSAGSALAVPIMKRAKLDPAATAEAHQRDNTATRAFTAVPIKASNGLCWSVDPESGDFRSNLTPVTLVECNGSPNQKWDVITEGKHTNTPGKAIVVSSLTNACLNFDSRRPAGNQVLLFSCGGRADGGGEITDSQQFNFRGVAGAFPLSQGNGNNGVCITAKNGRLDQSSCNPATASGDQLFTIGEAGAAAPPPAAPPAPAPPANNNQDKPTSTPSSPAPATTLTINKLDEAGTAEAQKKDNGAVRAATAVPIKSADGKCLRATSGTGDFRNNLVPVEIVDCDGSATQQWDVITSGAHNNVPGTALIVNTVIGACLNLDERRRPGNQVLLFSCGGRADGGGEVTNSQLFKFDGKKAGIPLAPTNQANTCLFNNNGRLDQQDCNNSGSQLFTIG
ncbi:hypothetical protein MIND_01083800 [Mycena indigotica]|uniref:Ricin B lectin domain-containing protein n=1 Tax=Mycena indigotica TaxID=2126181 RepID=A0A8H6SAZ8_9AGAR|nr:uncharacterized protein MIND_01083800 [Mycena indigotica]KAF7295440.1 hypothetical protein MIND_01083800 [Mycena indigotica]